MAEAIFKKLEEAGLAGLPREEHPEALTVDAWMPFHEKFSTEGSVLTRCLFMKDKKKQLFLLVTLASTKTDLKVFSAAVGSKEPRFASEDILAEKLSVVKGAVNPFAILNDASNEVSLVLEDALANSDKPLCFHPSDNTKTVIITADQLKAYLAHHKREFTTVDLSKAPEPAKAQAAKPKAAPKKAAPKPSAAGGANRKNKEGILVTKEDDFATWYRQVITKADLIEYYDVSGCYILRPAAMAIWKHITRFFDDEITKLGVEPCYFPMFVTKGALEREESHVEGFSAEVAWVTKSGDGELTEPIAIRPTSETVMYPSFAKWIRSYRDLPLKLNQWCNVVRWEFSHPTPFIRTREFLWQEGHTAHETEVSADEEVLQILDLYARVYEEYLAVPVVKGRKTEKEKFAGGKYTTTVEAFVPTVGRSVQGATSHCLGYGFAEMFGIEYEGKDGKKHMPCQNSWGLTTRTIGVMIMVHADDDGLVLPPMVASTQVVFVPVGINKNTTEEQTANINKACTDLCKRLQDVGVRAQTDLRDNITSGEKCFHWELRGVPVRIELGPKELEAGNVMACIRYNKKKTPLACDGFEANIKTLLTDIQSSMLENARKVRDERTATLKSPEEWSQFVPELNKKKTVLAPFCNVEECEDAIKKDTAEESAALAAETEVDARAPSMGAKTLCMPFNMSNTTCGKQCIHPACKYEAKGWTLFGRSY